MNLVINAAEAIGVEGGTVEVTTYSRELSDGKLEGNLFLENGLPGLYVALRVADNGCGMDEATRGAPRRCDGLRKSILMRP
jgi:two-component system cell cycle sensor histidine kinase/response regulator CckA